MFFAADAAAENPPVGTEVAPKVSPPPELSTYKLEVGDNFVVTVDGYPEYSKERIPVPVQQDGYVSYPLIGLIKVAGLTVSELEEQMQSAFSKHLPTARVFVTLMRPKRTILVFGAVEPRARGNLHVFEIGQVYLLQALASAGINYELADLTDISIWRRGKLFKKVDYLNLISAGGPDIPLKDHDTIFIPSVFQQRPVRVYRGSRCSWDLSDNRIPGASDASLETRWRVESRFRGFAQIRNPYERETYFGRSYCRRR